MMLLVPAPIENRNAVNGAMTVICLGRLSMTLAAIATIQSTPPAACIMAAEVTTARMMASAAAGGSPGASPKMNTRTNVPRPPHRPTPTPPARVPMTIAPRTTSASRTKLTVMSFPSFLRFAPSGQVVSHCTSARASTTAQASATSSLASSRRGRAASRASLSSSIAACRKASMLARSVEIAVSRRPSATAWNWSSWPGTPRRPCAARQPWRSADPAAATRPLPPPGWRKGRTGPGQRCRRTRSGPAPAAMTTPTVTSDRSLIVHPPARTLACGDGDKDPTGRHHVFDGDVFRGRVLIDHPGR